MDSNSPRKDLLFPHGPNLAQKPLYLVGTVLKYHLPMIHCYADDSQVYISFSPDDRVEQLAVVRNMENCIRDIRFWMSNNGLKFNDKTEFLTSQTAGKTRQYQYSCG